MPYEIIKASPKCYEVINIQTGRVHSRCTTLEKAKKQVHLLYGIDHGFIPTGIGGYAPMRKKIRRRGRPKVLTYPRGAHRRGGCGCGCAGCSYGVRNYY